MPNRLAHETSPYLLQHAGNPVDWYPWGTEALERARREDKPIIVSIGYAACHWCHVMERESFEDGDTARLMNDRFVSIKVDREERPDLDGIYMQAVQAMTGHGGWPMTVFLTPEGGPFYGGTYFPPEDRHGLPSFRRILTAVADSYASRRSDVERTVRSMRELYAASHERALPTGELTPAILDRAVTELVQRYDPMHGGFDRAPKFPQTMALDFLLRHWRRTGAVEALDIVRTSFLRMAQGGIYDQVGGGFHRYSVDTRWLVPHFEKMLYDNALLARLGVHLWQATGEREVRRVTEETLDWVAREMTDRAGGFYSTLDADSEGHEGKFYLWDADEFDALLGAAAERLKAHWGVTAEGNFEGRNILHLPQDNRTPDAFGGDGPAARLAELISGPRQTLYAARARRPRPMRDEKILAGWNGLMLRAVAEAARVFARDDYRALALRNGTFLRQKMVKHGRLSRSHKDGVTKLAGYLEDHAAVALGFLALYELTFDACWVEAARAITRVIDERFWSDEIGAFFDTASDHEQLVTRPREVTDNAVPSGTSLAVELYLRIAELTGDQALRSRAEAVLAALAEPMTRYAIAFGHALGAADLAIHGAVGVALVGDAVNGFDVLNAEVSRHYVPALVLAGGAPGDGGQIALLEGRPLQAKRATAYVCRNYACDEPVTEAAALGAQLQRASITARRA
ncbi:MAG: thioredoxin domain-containing protein [Gemmatimonadaceae bacterium]